MSDEKKEAGTVNMNLSYLLEIYILKQNKYCKQKKVQDTEGN